MYPTSLDKVAINAGMGNAQYIGNGTNAVPQAPPPSGVASRIQELQRVTLELIDLADGLRVALGIAIPQTENAKNTQAPSLADAITESTRRICNANNDLRDVIGHLNS